MQSDGVQISLSDSADEGCCIIPSSLRLSVTRVDASLQTTPYLANIEDDGQFLKVGPTAAETPVPDLAGVARKFYQYFDDDYDFLTVFTPVVTEVPYGEHDLVRNDVRGIGLDVFGGSSQYGSHGKLRGINFIGLPANLGYVLRHETMHQWGVYLDHSLELDDGEGHWGAVNFLGYLAGFEFRDNSDGSYTLTRWYPREDQTYAPMELYLMGMISAPEVPPITVLRGVDLSQLMPGAVVHPTSIREVSIQEVVDIHGPRIPDFHTSPKSFRMAGVLVTPGRAASPAEMALYSRLLEQFGLDEDSPDPSVAWVHLPPFHRLTGGRARMDTTLGSLR